MTNDKIPQPTKISAKNIIKPSFDEISEDHRQAFEALQKQRQDQLRAENEAKMKKQAEYDMEVFLAAFDKDRHGKITPPEEIKLPPLPASSTEPAVSSGMFSKDQLATIDSLITENSQQSYDTMLQNIKASQNTSYNCPSSVGAKASTENTSLSAPPRSSPMNPYYSQDG